MRTSRRLAMAAAAILAASTSTAYGWTTVTNTNGDTWNVNDALVPGLDSGSIHNTGTNSLQGYGGIRVKVPGSARLNGILLRGFGQTPDSPTLFTSKQAVQIGTVAVKRTLSFNTAEAYARFLDTFTNTTSAPITIQVAFGGQLGYNTGTNQGAIASTSSGDTTLSSADSWASFYSPSAAAGSATVNGTSATVTGTFDKTGNFLRDPFTVVLPTTGDESNHVGFVNTLTIPAGETKALVHFVVTGLSETRGTPVPAAGLQVAAVQAKAAALAAAPPLSDIATAEACRIANFTVAACGSAAAPALGPVVKDPSLGATTSSPYDVVGKSISDLKADMASGRTTAQQIMRAYLDRIAAYDSGPLGLHSVIMVAPNAMAQAKAADDARAAGDTKPLLGIPILAKDIFDTKDMKTTGGSLVFANYQPTKDAWIVAKLREAGAIIMGKANLSEFANDGHFSSSASGQVWNAFDASKSSIGSSGGSGLALASSLAPPALGPPARRPVGGPPDA